MPQKLSIHLDNHDQKYTVSEMRRRLAQVLSKLHGTAEVSFSFDAVLPSYEPPIVHSTTVRSVISSMREEFESQAVLGELARPEND
jgi:hypothetical protein